MKRASYKEGIAWIAINDEPTEMDEQIVSEQISSLLLADLFLVGPEKVGKDIVSFRFKIKIND